MHFFPRGKSSVVGYTVRPVKGDAQKEKEKKEHISTQNNIKVITVVKYIRGCLRIL